ncbi:hypothetical protein GCM10010082_31910 [Kushneria pakistanensis]|uniref:Uncharacterized protein n=1 Tax=Kushneria pakistanensis TaxID=1508770 RepID=A0ABQ3FR83_9GAMM|nr:hypothetical protein [Kushneria pakistanensis]GHC34808.1 hypothetical protein GCM10010082_31910 [Kushneria pakistanensis]
MIDINTRLSQNSVQNSGTVKNRTEKATSEVAGSNQQASSGIRISSLAQELNAAQARADARDSSLDRDALSAKASDIRSQFYGSAYQQNKDKYDAEVPNTNDPAHLDRAKQATTYVNGSGSNPFKGLAPDQLSLIIYDEGGTFTMNEKRAALDEQWDQTQAWKREVVAEINRQWDEKNGDISDVLKDIMDYFDNLPPIEEAQYDSSWRQSLQNNIAHFSSGRSNSDNPGHTVIPALNKYEP